MGLVSDRWHLDIPRFSRYLGWRLTVCIILGLGVYVLFLGLDWGVRQQKQAAHSAVCNGNLCYVGLLLHYYHGKYGHFPPAYTIDKNGRPMHSWRALLLEFAVSTDRNYDFNEPWDGPNNIKLADQIPIFLICPSDHDRYKPSTTFTSYVLIRAYASQWAI